MKQQSTLLDTLFYRSRDDHGKLGVYEDKGVDFQKLVDANLIIETEPSNSIMCRCGIGDADLIWVEHPTEDLRTPVVRCDYCGIYRLKPEELRDWEICYKELAHKIGESLDFSVPFLEVIPDIVWHFGRRKRCDFYYVRRIYREEMTVLRVFFESHPAGVIITSTPTDKNICAEMGLKNFCIYFEEIGSMDDDCRITADLSKIETEILPVNETPQRSRIKRGSRAANIEKLLTELKEHYRASKDSYYETGHILPRPTQEEIAKRVGIGQRAVSRCLADADAVMLQLLWKQVENIQAILQS
jgi:hypothetical protein